MSKSGKKSKLSSEELSEEIPKKVTKKKTCIKKISKEIQSEPTPKSKKKSKEIENEPTPKSKKKSREIVSEPTPKSKKKSREIESEPAPTPKSKKKSREVESEPTPKSKKKSRDIMSDERSPNKKNETDTESDKYNDNIINTFPNALLMGGISEEESEEVKEESSEHEIRQDDLWDLVDGIDEEKPKKVAPKSNTRFACPACEALDSMIEDIKTGTIVCKECGVVNEEMLDFGPEWKQYASEDNRGDGVNRCGCSINPFFPKSSQGTFLVGATNNRIKRRQKWGCVVYKEKVFNEECDKITAICNKHGITKNIIDDAKILFKKISDCKHKTGANIGKQIIIRGDNRKSIIAACVFKSCEKNKRPKNVKEIAIMFSLGEKIITKGIKHLDAIIRSNDDGTGFYDQFLENDIITDFIRDRCPILKIYGDDIELAVRIANNCCKLKLASDHNPETIAAGSVLATVTYCKLNAEKKVIAKVFGTTDVTIGKIYAKIWPLVDALIDNEQTDYIIKRFSIYGKDGTSIIFN